MAPSQLVSLCEIMIFSYWLSQKCDCEINSSTPFSPFQNKIDKVIHNSIPDHLSYQERRLPRQLPKKTAGAAQLQMCQLNRCVPSFRYLNEDKKRKSYFFQLFSGFFKFKLIFYSECMRCHSADKEMPKWGRSRWKTPHLWSSLPKTLSLSIFFALFGWYHLSTIDKFVPWCEKYSKIWRHFRGECTTIYSVWDIDVLYYVHTYLHIYLFW